LTKVDLEKRSPNLLWKSRLRWLVWGAVIFFLVKVGKDRAGEVAAIEITHQGWFYLAIALGFTLLAHIWSGLVWGKILHDFQQPLPYSWVLRVYLKTNIAKYIPGNIWHYYGRISAIQEAGGSLEVASFSVLLEPLLMAAAALIIALSGNSSVYLGWQVLALLGIILGVHPRILNFLMRLLGKLKGKTEASLQLQSYPLLPLLGEIGFIGLRGTGFVFALLALSAIAPWQIHQILSGFSWAWLLGLIIPGAPGGIGVFEATAIAILQPLFSPGLLLSAVAIFRVVSLLAEVIAAGLSLVGNWDFISGDHKSN
jgi:glycosyltransferase 2 family protein